MLAKLNAYALYATNHVKDALSPLSDTKAATHPMLTTSYPGDECCTTYSDPNYGGWSGTHCLDGQDYLYVDLTLFTTNVESIRCGRRVSFELCDRTIDAQGDDRYC